MEPRVFEQTDGDVLASYNLPVFYPKKCSRAERVFAVVEKMPVVSLYFSGRKPSLLCAWTFALTVAERAVGVVLLLIFYSVLVF